MKFNSTSTFVLCVFLFGLVGCASTAPRPEPSLYDRLGGKPAISAVVNDFIDIVGTDDRINAKPAEAKVPAVKLFLTDFVCQATGGPCVYRGRSMRQIHAGMKIADAEFDAVVGDLVKTLDKYKVPEREKGELLALLGPLRPDIVEVP